MAQETVGIKIQVDSGEAGKSVGSLKSQLREAQAEVMALSEKFGATSEQAVAAAKKAALLKDAIGDAKALTDAFNPDAKFKAVSSSLMAVAGGFSAVQGAMGLLGVESESVQKTLLKVQSAMAISQGLQAIGEGIDSFKQMKAVAIDAFKGIKAAISSTGIGLLVVALGTIVAYWDEIKGAVSGVSAEQEKLNKKTKDNLEAEKGKLTALNGQENILKIQGKSEKEILNIKIKQTDQVIKATEESIKQQRITLKAQIEASKRNKEILEGILKFIAVPITSVLKSVDLLGKALGKDFGLEEKFLGGISSFVFDPKQVEKDGENTLKELDKQLNDLKNQRAGFQLSIQNIDKQAAQKAAEQRKKEYEQELEDEKKRKERLRELNQITDEANRERTKKRNEIDKEIDKTFLKEKDKLATDQLTSFQKKVDELRVINLQNLQNDATKEIEIRRFAISEQQRINEENYNKGISDRNQYLARKKELDNAEMDLDKLVAENKKAQLNEVGAALGSLTALAGKDTAAGKALGIATALINTYQGASEAIKQKSTLPSPFDVITKVANVGAIIATGLKTVKAITAVKVPNVGGGSVGGQSVPSFSAAPIPPVPSPQVQSTLLNTQAIQQMGNATNRAYVIESDVTNSQERIRRINRAARLG